MKFISALAVAGVASTVAAQGTITNYQDSSCVDGVHIVSLGGEYTTVGNLSLLLTLAQDIYNAIPGSNMYQIPYTELATAQEDLASATPLLSQHLISYAASCPQTKIVTIGYSIGAAILMNVLCGGTFTGTNPDPLPRHYRHRIVANVVYGDPTFKLGMRSAAGTCTSASGVAARVYPGKCYPFGRKTKSYCDENDPQCCGGDDPEVHFEYPQLYDGDATNWVLAKWHYYKNHSG